MILIFWLLVYLGVLILEVAVLPVFGGSWTPAVASAFLVMGIALQDFYPAFWFAGLAGLAADFSILANPLTLHTVSALAVFFAISFFKAVARLDEPLFTIASLSVGFLFLPLSWLAGVLAGEVFFRRGGLAVSGFFHFDRLFLVESVGAAIFLVIFSWIFIRRFSKRRDERLSRI